MVYVQVRKQKSDGYTCAGFTDTRTGKFYPFGHTIQEAMEYYKGFMKSKLDGYGGSFIHEWELLEHYDPNTGESFGTKAMPEV